MSEALSATHGGNSFRVRFFAKPSRFLLGFLVLLGTVLAVSGCAPEDPLEAIRNQHAKANYKESLEPLRELVDADPTNTQANLLLGVTLLRVGDSGAAVWPLRVAVKDPALEVEAGLLLTEAALQSRFKDQAIEAADAVLLLEPENIAALEMRIQAYQDSGRAEDVLGEVERVLALDPENKKVLVPRVVAYLSLTQEDEAAEALHQAQLALAPGLDSKAPEPVLRAARAKLCVVTGMFTFERGDREGADAQYAKCVEQYPADSLVVRESILYYDGTGQSPLANAVLDAAFTLEPNSEFRVLKAERAEKMEKWDETERLLREDAEERASSQAWFKLGDYFVRRENLAEAALAFKRAVEATPEPEAMVRFAYADTLIQLGDLERARLVAQELQASAMKDLIEGRVLAAEGRWEEALGAFEAGIRLWPNNPGARFLAAETAEKLGRFDEAASQYREAIRADKALTRSALNLARLQEAQGAEIQALDRLGHYVRSHPNDPEGYIDTIRVAQRTGQSEIAKQGLSRLAKLPGQKGIALSISATMMGRRKGPEAAVKLITSSPLDLTDPANAKALAVLVKNLDRLERSEEAEKYVRDALAAHPDCADFEALLGIHMKRRDGSTDDATHDEATAAFRRALALDENHAEALAGLAGIEAEAEHYAQAIELYDRASLADVDRAGAALAAFALIRKSAPLEEQEQRGEAFLLRHLHSAQLASQLSQVVAARGKNPKRALALAQRAAMFDRRNGKASREAFEALARTNAEPEAGVARAALQKAKPPTQAE